MRGKYQLYPLSPICMLFARSTWQYVSKHRKYGIVEFYIGPNSMEHAGEWKQDNVKPEHFTST